LCEIISWREALPRKYPFTPILGWSFSRYDKLDICKRQYYYEYYARHDREIPPERIAFLKSFTSIPLEIGNLVHETISTLLRRLRKSTDPINPAKVLNYSYNLVDRTIKNKNFFEIYYQQLDDIDSEEMKERVGACLQNFFNSRWYKWLTEDAIAQRSDWVIEPKDYGEIRINGLKAYCKVDFLFPTTQGIFYILDWKTGKVDIEKHTRQMKGYVLYAREIFDTRADQVKPVIAYLGDDYEELESSFSEDDLKQVVSQIASETQEMYQYCENIEENIPKAKLFFPIEPSDFCAYCNYKELCEK
jgi:hypothetical protein